jgi:hypothetical protein
MFLPERSAGAKTKLWRQIWAGHFVNFSLQNARAGICHHCFVRGLFYGVNAVNTIK